MDGVFIDDGYTRTKDIAAVAGIHPAVSVSFRPALSKDRIAYGVKADAKNADALDAFEVDLLSRQSVIVNGETLTKANAAKLNPVLRVKILDLVLMYSPADEAGN